MNRFEDKRIDEALELLNDAVRDKKSDLQAAWNTNIPISQPRYTNRNPKLIKQVQLIRDL